MKITPTTLTLKQFFSVCNEQFLIPAYRRRYARGQRQQRKLFDATRFLTSEDTHLLGMVRFLSDTLSPGIKQLEVADGRQWVIGAYSDVSISFQAPTIRSLVAS